MDGVYSNHSNEVSTPASLNQPLRIPISNAVQPGQSLKAIRSGGPAGFAGSTAFADTRGGAEEGAGSFLSQLETKAESDRETAASANVLRKVFIMAPDASCPSVTGTF